MILVAGEEILFPFSEVWTQLFWVEAETLKGVTRKWSHVIDFGGCFRFVRRYLESISVLMVRFKFLNWQFEQFFEGKCNVYGHFYNNV